MSSKTLIASFVSDRQSPVLCSADYDGHMYIGGSDGTVYQTIDGSYYREFWNIAAGPVTSLAFYGGAMFAGTSPDGGVYMHNFNTGNRFHYVVSGDDEVSAMSVHEDVLYAGTARSGIILSYDGDRWRKEYESHRSISSISSFGNDMYVFFSDSNVVLVFSGGKWSFMNDGDSIFSVGGKKMVTTSIDELASYGLDEIGIGHSAVAGNKMYFSGVKIPNVYSYDGSSVVVEWQFGDGSIGGMAGSENQIFVAVDDTVYVNVAEESATASSDGGGTNEEGG